MKPVPPLLAICEGRRVRPRKAPIMAPKEIVLHMAVADVLRRFIKPDWRWSHYPAGELRNPRVAAKLKAMGVMAGWPNLLLLDPNGQLRGLELKREGGVLTEPQEAFRLWCITHGVPHAVVSSIKEALTVLEAWGCLRVAIGGAA